MEKLIKGFILLIALNVSWAWGEANLDKLAKDDWLHVQSENFDVITDLGEEKARHLVDNLEAYRYFSIQMMGLKVLDTTKPLKIMAISESANFRKFGFPDNWAGVFGLNQSGYAAISNVTGYKADSSTSTFGRQVLFHEYNHFLLRFVEDTKQYPTWYDEGFAEYWGTFKYSDQKISLGSAGAIAFRAPALFSRSGNLSVDTEKMFKAKQYPDGKEAQGAFYAQAFFTIHYFNSSPELRQQLAQYLQLVNLGYGEEAALQKSCGLNFSDLDKRIKKYAGDSLQMRVITANNGNLNFPKKPLTVNEVNEAEFYRLGTEVIASISAFDKPTLLNFFEKTIALNPEYTFAKTQILVRNYSNDPAKLESDIEKNTPNDPTYLTYKGNQLRNEGELLHATGIVGWNDKIKQARSYYRRAIKSDRGIGNAYLGLGCLYTYFPDSEPMQEGIVGLETGSLFEREEGTFLKLAHLYLRTNNLSGALVALRNSYAFSKDKDKFQNRLPLENLEFINTLSTATATASEKGLTYSDASLYTGQLQNGKPQGEGKIVRPNGTVFEGNFSDGFMQGKGKIVTPNGFVYDGNFEKGIARGKAKVTYPDALNIVAYEGENEFTFPHGKGKLIDKQGEFEGEFLHSYQQGMGSFTTKDSKTLLKGKWIDGRYEWPEANDMQFFGNINANGQRDGLGVCKNISTKKIEWCEFANGVKKSEDEKEAIKK